MRVETILFYLLVLFLPTQLGKHFWPDFSIVSGIRIDYLSPTLYVTDVVVFLFFISWGINRFQKTRITQNIGRIRFSERPKVKNSDFQSSLSIPKMFGLFVGFLLLNIFLSHNYLNGLYHLFKFLEFSFLAYYVATTIVRVEQVKKVFLLLGIGVIGQSLLAIAQFVKQGSLNGIFYFFGERLFTSSTAGIANASINGELVLRAYGAFSHPNVLAGFLLVSMIGLLFTFSWTRRFEKILWVVALLLGSSAMLLTMSRVAIILWISLLLGSFLFMSLRALFKQGVAISYRIASLFFLAMTIIFMVFILTQTPFGSRFIQTNLTEEAVVTRIDLMTASWQLFSMAPIVGVGFGNFLPQLATIATPLPLNLYLQPVHNIFLLVLAETGIIGFSVFVWFLVATYQRLFRLASKTTAPPYLLFTVLLSVILILGSFDHYFLTLQQGQLLFAFIVALCWSSMNS